MSNVIYIKLPILKQSTLGVYVALASELMVLRD